MGRDEDSQEPGEWGLEVPRLEEGSRLGALEHYTEPDQAADQVARIAAVSMVLKEAAQREEG